MEVLDINRDLIKLVTTDTYCAPYDFIAGASRNTWVGGNCAIRLCEHMKAELLEAASQLLNVPKKMILMENGFFITSDGNQKATRKEVIHYGCFKMKKKFIITERYSSESNAGSYGAHFVALKIHKKTGELTITDYVAACDVGKAINPTLLEGQIHGGIQMGIGMALKEELIFDDKGQILNANFKGYKMPKAKDMPKNMKVIFVEDGEPEGPYGAKSIGEAAVNPVAPAIVNAINNCLGVEFVKFPVTVEMIKEKLQEM